MDTDRTFLKKIRAAQLRAIRNYRPEVASFFAVAVVTLRKRIIVAERNK